LACSCYKGRIGGDIADDVAAIGPSALGVAPEALIEQLT